MRLHPFRPTPWLIGIPEVPDIFIPITEESPAAEDPFRPLAPPANQPSRHHGGCTPGIPDPSESG
jgi:hypothetical protein